MFKLILFSIVLATVTSQSPIFEYNGECDFSNNDRCGWTTTNMTYYNQSSIHGIATKNELEIFKVQQFTLFSPPLPTLSKSCVLQADIYASDIFYSSSTLDIASHNRDQVTQLGHYELYIYDTWFNCAHERICFKRKMNYTLGYSPEGSYVRIDGQLKTSYGFSKTLFGFNSIRMVNCDPAKIQFDCYFESASMCSGWVHDYHRYRGEWKFDNSYLYNDYLDNKLAEFRSPVITPTKGSCLSFDYFIVSFEDGSTNNILNVTKINLGGDGSESTLWSANKSTHGQTVNVGNWVKVELDIITDVDIDIGFISKAPKGIVAIDNLLLRHKPCSQQ